MSEGNDVIYVVGFNSSSQLGLDHNKHVTELTKWTSCIDVKSIYCSANITIYLDAVGKLYTSGYGGNSQIMNELKLAKFAIVRNNIHNNHNITIPITVHKIFASVPGRCIFCITNNNTLYGYGRNRSYQLGLNDNKNRYDRIDLIPNLNNVVTLSPAYLYTIALCNPSLTASIIIKVWSRRVFIIVPSDVIKLIESFSNCNIVYSTGEFFNYFDKKSWSKMKLFEGKEIVKVECGRSHSVLLESNDNIWTYGVNNYYQLGVTKDWTNKIPVLLNNFVNAKINILDVKCGRHHNLVLGSDGNVYSWGCNVSGQCGHGTSNDIKRPRMIAAMEEYQAVEIKCGAFHSYIGAMDKMDKLHFLFGDNNYNECSLCECGDKKIKLPRCMNETVRKLTNMVIKSVYLGYGNTFVVVQN